MEEDTYKDMVEKGRETVKEPGGGSIRPATAPSMRKVGLTIESELEKREGPFGPVGTEAGKEKGGTSEESE